MTQSISLRLCRVDYTDPVHMRALIDLLDAYASESEGGAEPLSDFTKSNLASALQSRPFMFSVLAFDEAQGCLPVGLVNCVEGFSTFACRPLVNIHDVVVAATHRGQRIGEQTMDSLARLAAAGQARVVTANQGRLIDRAWQATLSVLRNFAGHGKDQPAGATA